MLATREKSTEFEFFLLSDKEQVIEEILHAYNYIALDQEVVPLEELLSSLLDLFVLEQIERQVVFGDMDLCHTQEECIKATDGLDDDDELFNEIFITQMEIISGFSTFGKKDNPYKQNHEVAFVKDVMKIITEMQLMHLCSTNEWSQDSFVYGFQDTEFGTLENSSLQEVW